MGLPQPQVDSRSPIVQRLQSEDLSAQLFAYILAGGGLGVQKSASIVIDILRELSSDELDSDTSSSAAAAAANLPGIVRVACKSLPACVTALQHGGDALSEVREEFYTLKRPLGMFRLSVVGILEALVHTNRLFVVNAVVECGGLLATLTDLFFEFEWNTFLHQSVFNIFSVLLRGGGGGGGGNNTSAGRAALMGSECRLADRILAAEEHSKEHFARTGLTIGYISFLTRIAAQLNSLALEEKAKELSPAPVSDALGRYPSWKAYSEGVLAERCAKEAARLGGDSAQGEDSEDEADTPGFGNDPNGFFSSIKSVFDDQEDDEDVESGDIGQNYFAGVPYSAVDEFSVEEAPFHFKLYDGPADDPEDEEDDDEEEEEEEESANDDDDDAEEESGDDDNDDDEDDDDNDDDSGDDDDDDDDDNYSSSKGKKKVISGSDNDDEEEEEEEE